jgi:hypothetical protein
MTGRVAGLARYEIRVRGRLNESWFDWLDGVTMTYEAESEGPGVTVLTGSFDQAALRGILAHLWDLNLTVLGVAQRESLADNDTAAADTRGSGLNAAGGLPKSELAGSGGSTQGSGIELAPS